MRCSALIAAFIILAQSASAQRNDFNFINFSSKDGLSSNTVNAILKDRFGYMWFATDDGINKFDGVNFTVYRHHPADSTSIGAGAVMAMQEDRSGNLWVGTNQTVSLYNREKENFINYDFTGKGTVRSLCIDHSGNVWVGTYSGLYVLEPRSGNTRVFMADPARPDQLLSNAIISIFEDSRNRIWIGTIAGLHLYVANSKSFQRFLQNRGDPFSLSDKIVRAVAEDLNGNIWIGTNDGGLDVLQPDGQRFKIYKHNATDKNTLSSDRVYAISVDNTGKLWLGTEDGLDIFDPRSAKVLRIAGDRRNKYSLRGKSIRSVFIGKDGIYWLGMYQAGVNKYDKNLAFFNLRQADPFDPHGLSSPTVTSLVEGPAGNIYVGTDGGGLNLYHRNTGLFDHLTLGSGDHDKVQSILTMERVGDEIWIGTYLEGLYVLNSRNGQLRHYTQGDGSNDLVSNEIFCIKKDSRGNVWIGTNGNGLNMYDPKAKIFHRFSQNSTEYSKNILPSNGFIRTIEEDRSGNIWIGSNGTGIAVYDPSEKTFRLLNNENSNLPSDKVQHIYADRNGNIWAGLPGGGLCLFDSSKGRFIPYSESEGLSNGVIYDILEDDSGKLWVSTNKGISSFDPKNRKFKNYSYYNGLQQSSFSMGAGLKTSDGELFFGGLDGFNYFKPGELNVNQNVPSLVLTDLKISNRTVIPGQNSPIKEHISVAQEIRLNYKQNFSLDFAALNYTAPQENQYSYKLDGFDKDWTQAGTSKTAVYTNLDPGTYTFRLKARSDDGLWNTPEKSIRLVVSPPFWGTAYAYAFYLLSALLVFWGLRYRAIRRLKNKFALEHERLQVKQLIEQERREAERIHEFDQVKIRFLTNLSHEFRTPIALIMAPTEKLLQQEANGKKLEELGLIRRNARRLLNLVNQLLDFRKLEESELKLNLTEGDLVSFVRDCGDSFKDISERKRINYDFSSSVGHFYTSFDTDKLERILFNLLSNAFKFTGTDGQVSLRIESDFPSGIRIILADNGVGMSHDIKEKIFDRFYQGDTGPNVINPGSGIGLSIAREFVKLHGGTVDVESVQGKGSVFTVHLPFKPISGVVEEVPTSSRPEPPAGKPLSPTPPAPEKPTVLLVEDHEDFRSYLSKNLSANYKIIEAADGKQGWQMTLSSHPQVIVSDINMPEMDGILLCRKIRSDKRTCHIPIILLTALTGDTNQLIGLNTGANDYLTKPFNFEILNAKVNNLLKLNATLKSTYSRQLKVAAPDVEIQSEDEKLLLKIARYIESNIDNPDLSVEELSKHVFISRGSLYNKILSLTGEAPVEFIRSIKLNKAAALLENSDMKISQIGYEVGFTSPNYFARAFKAKFNLSPSEYVSLKKKPH